jgi:hypothetical protein
MEYVRRSQGESQCGAGLQWLFDVVISRELACSVFRQGGNGRN